MLAGEEDILTSVEEMREPLDTLPQAASVVVPDAGHAVVASAFGPFQTSAASPCVRRALTAFFDDAAVAAYSRVKPSLAPTAVPPTSLGWVRPWARVPGRRGRTVRAVVETLSDVDLCHPRESRTARLAPRGPRAVG